MRGTMSLLQLGRRQTLGFVGLGAMGSNMATNLMLKTFRDLKPSSTPSEKPAFVVYDASSHMVTRFLSAPSSSSALFDVIPASSPAGVVKLASTVFTMLPASPEVEQVYLAEEEQSILDGLAELSAEEREATLLVDSTTLDQAVGVRVARDIEETGASMLDAPVSGGVIGASEGTLAFMVGGRKEALERAEPYLELMGKRITHCGASGNGLAAKICNNLLLGISMAGTAEAMLLGESLGLSPRLLAKIINESTGRCWASEVNNPAPGSGGKGPAERNYEGGFLARLMAKDLNLAVEAARNVKTPIPVGGLTTQLYNKLAGHEDLGAKDFGVVYQYLKAARDAEGGFTGQKK